MKKNKVKNKVPKYEFGTLIENPATALYENQIAKVKAQQEGASNPLANGVKIFGNLAQMVGTNLMNKGMAKGGVENGVGGETGDGYGIARFLNKNNGTIQSGLGGLNGLAQFFGAMGGQVPGGVPVEVEGQEVGETPNGQLLDFQGPSHENGGIPISLPPGTEIYSKRIKVDGVSMADRKKKRERKTVTLESLFEKNKTDALIKNSLQRIQENNQIEEDSDNKIQMVVKQLLDKQENPNLEKHWAGLTVGDDPTDPFGLKKMFANKGMMTDNVYGGFGNTKQLSISTPVINKNANNDFLDGMVKANPGTEEKTEEGKGFKISDLLGGATFGDMMGMAGNFYQADKIMDTIMKNRAGDTPNINAFKDYGKDGLNTLDKTKQYVNQIRDQKLKDLELSRTGSVKRNSNSARSINTVRALNLATDAGVNNNKEETYNAFAKQMMAILGQQAGMENQRDQIVMGGEDTRDDRDRKDRDNYFSQLITGHKNKGQVMSETGRNLNQIKQNKTSQNLVNTMSAYFTTDANGVTTLKPGVTMDDVKRAFSKSDIKGEENPFAGYSKAQLMEYIKTMK